jgi:hypothetical protein
MRVPEGWTDDLNIAIAAGRTVEELVEVVLEAATRRDTTSTTIDRLMKEFGLSRPDAELALDRALGGVVRAATGQAENCPSKKKDPVAWTSYQRCLKAPGLIAAIYPQFAKPSQRP